MGAAATISVEPYPDREPDTLRMGDKPVVMEASIIEEDCLDTAVRTGDMINEPDSSIGAGPVIVEVGGDDPIGAAAGKRYGLVIIPGTDGDATENPSDCCEASRSRGAGNERGMNGVPIGRALKVSWASSIAEALVDAGSCLIEICEQRRCRSQKPINEKSHLEDRCKDNEAYRRNDVGDGCLGSIGDLHHGFRCHLSDHAAVVRNR